MPPLLPFRGLRPDTAVTGPLTDVVCPPYDVISQSQRVQLLARSQYNIVRLELPAGDYAGAAALLADWERDGVLNREEKPALYGYRMSYRDHKGGYRETLGVIGALVLEPPGRGILPHEQTTPKDKTDRLELIRATRANTSPIWCLCAEPGLAELVCATAGATASKAIDDEGVTHELWPIYDRTAHEALSRLTSAAPLLVADGHHRYETALAYQAEVGNTGASSESHRDVAGPDAVLSLVVELSDRYLEIMAIHRAISGLPAGTEVLDAFREGFTLSPAEPGALDALRAGSSRSPAEPGGPAPFHEILCQMESAGAVGLVTRRGAFLARPRPDHPSAAYGLDSARVDAVLSGLPPHELAYEHDLGRAVAGVREGRLDAVVLCRPPTVEQIAATARGGERMPPKTTFFWPKPRTGMVLRDW
jgi:uncharacterized protein (DUF1015 family)